MIRFYRLFDLLNRKGMKKTDLLQIMSSPTLAKLSKGEVVKLDVIDRICEFLKCQPSDIMEHISTEEPFENRLTVSKAHEIYGTPDDPYSMEITQIRESDTKEGYDEVYSTKIDISDK